MASHLETELGKLRGIIKIGSLAESQVAEAVKSVLQNLVPEGKEVKKNRK
jgi:phosphate transport system protein